MSPASGPPVSVAAGRLRLAILAWVVLVVVGGSGGCGATSAGRTGGLELRYERREEPVGLAIWTLASDGVLRFAGGRDAVLGRESWRCAVGDADLARLQAVVEDLLAASADPSAEATESAGSPGTTATGQVRTRLDLRTSEGRLRLRRAGDPPALEPLLGILRELSAARLDPVLQRLPRPTEPPAAGTPES